MAGPGFGHNQHWGRPWAHFYRVFLPAIAGGIDGEADADRLEGICTEVKHLLHQFATSRSAIAHASSYSFMRCFWLAGGSWQSFRRARTTASMGWRQREHLHMLGKVVARVEHRVQTARARPDRRVVVIAVATRVVQGALDGIDLDVDADLGPVADQFQRMSGIGVEWGSHRSRKRLSAVGPQPEFLGVALAVANAVQGSG